VYRAHHSPVLPSFLSGHPLDPNTMDQGKFSIEQIRPLRERLSQWTGNKISQLIEQKPPPDSPFSHESHNDGATNPVATSSGGGPGVATSSPAMSPHDPDHHRLQFKVSDTPWISHFCDMTTVYLKNYELPCDLCTVSSSGLASMAGAQVTPESIASLKSPSNLSHLI